MTFEVILLEPAVDFLRTVEPKLRAKAFRTIELLKEFGPQTPMPHARKLTGYELFELRVRFGSNICRLFYFPDEGTAFVIASGYIKKTNKTDKREIERALRFKAEYVGGKEQK